LIVVTTPTGQIGSKIIPDLLAAGEQVRVITRDPGRLASDIKGRVDIVQGSLDDSSTVSKALHGAECLFWLVPPASLRTNDLKEHYLHFTRAACLAIISSTIKRVVGVSSVGRGIANNAGPISASHAMDAMIESTGVSYRALWNGSFMENMLRVVQPIKQRGIFSSSARPDVKFPQVATHDIAARAASLLLDREWTGQGGLAVLGPEDLSYDDMATVISDVLGIPVRFQQISGEVQKERLLGLGASESFAQGMVNALAEISRGACSAEPRTADNTTPTSFRQWCETVLKPAFIT
jgi:uncharacterized protein YbjT (DUF2867 family)